MFCLHCTGRGAVVLSYSGMNYPWECSSLATSRPRDLWVSLKEGGKERVEGAEAICLAVGDAHVMARSNRVRSQAGQA